MSLRYPLLNRELGILGFNERVLSQAADTAVPLLERLRFICITSSNLDEFFEVRMAGMQEQMRDNPGSLSPDGMSLQHVYDLVVERAHRLVHQQYVMLQDTVFPALESEGIYFHGVESWTEAQTDWARDYFQNELLPVLTPIGLDPAHPFPRVLNKSLNFVVELEGKDAFGRQAMMGIVQAPRALPRLVRMPEALSGYSHGFVLLSSLLQRFVDALFPHLVVRSCNQFRITRNSELFVDEDEITNLRVALQGELPARHLGNAVRLEVSAETPPHMIRRLLDESELNDRDCYRVDGPVNLVRLMQLPEMVDRPDLKFVPHIPAVPKAIAAASNMFDAIDQGDILLHHPYESFQPVLELLLQAAKDPQVVAVTNAAELLEFQQLVRMVPIGESLAKYVVNLVRATRHKSENAPDFVKKYVNYGGSIRAAQFIVLAAKARALSRKRYHVTYEDITALAIPVLRHRILLNFHAESERIDSDEILTRLIAHLPPPKES